MFPEKAEKWRICVQYTPILPTFFQFSRVLKDCVATGIAIANLILFVCGVVVSILMADLWNQLRDLLIRKAEIPPDSQKTVVASKTVERCLMYATAYGDDMYCLLLDPNPLDVWECNPVIKFLPVSGDVSYPATKLPETHHVLGIAANAAQSTIVMGHYMYTDISSLICIDIFTINAYYEATLMQSFSTETSCSGSGLLGTFVSPQVDQYMVLWGDLSNNDHFDTFSAKKVSTIPDRTATAFKRTSVREFELNYQQLSELYPAIHNSVFNCHAYGVGHQHPNHLAVMVYEADLDNRVKPQIVFHTVIKLPFQLCFRAADVLDGASVRYPAVIVRMMRTSDGSQVCLVRVSVEIHAVTTSETTAAEGDRAAVTTIAPQAAHLTSVVQRATTAHQYVYLLLSFPHHAVIDMYISRKYEKCTIDGTGRYIVRFGAKRDA